MPSPFASKLTRLLQTFDEAELKAFERWLQSPWCNSNKNLPRLLACLKPYHPEFSNAKLSKEKLFRQVLPRGKFSERRMNNLLSEGYLAAEQFLAFQRFAREPGMQADLLTSEFQTRYLDDWFFKASVREIDRLEEKTVNDWEDYLDLFRLHRRIYQHPHTGPRMEAGRSAVAQMNVHLDLHYLLEKAAVLNEMIFRNRLFKDEKHDVEAELKKWRAASEGVQHPVLDLYQMRFAYPEKDMLPQYRILREAVLERFGALNAREQKTQLLSLLNDTALLIKQGRLDITDNLPLYRLGLESGAIFNQGKLTRNTFTAIVSASNTKGDFDFTRYFIDTYTSYLDVAVRQDCTAWARAHTAYWQKDLDKCLAMLRDHSFETPHFQLIGRVLQTQAYFDLFLQDPNYQSYLFSYFDTFEKWLQRERSASQSVKVSFLRFVQICRALARCHAGVDIIPEKIEKILDRESNIQALNWLQRKKTEVLERKSRGGLQAN